MSEPHSIEQLLSAYFDGELNQEERAFVENEIAQNPSLRTRLGQWKEQRNAIRAIPPIKLSNDLSIGVLAQIRQHPLTAKAAGAFISEDSLTSSRNATSLPEDKRHTKPSFRGRNRIAAAGSLAGLVLLALFLFNPFRPQQDLAQTSPGENRPSGEPNQFELAEVADAHSSERSAGRLAAQGDRSAMGSTSRADADDLRIASAPESRPLIEALLRARAPLGILPVQATPATELAPDAPSLASIAPPGIPMGAIEGESFSANELPPVAAMQMPHRKSNEHLAADDSAAPGRRLPSPNSSVASESSHATDNHIVAAPTSTTAAPPIGVQQIFVVDFRIQDQPLAVVSEIFSRNQIDILTPGNGPSKIPFSSQAPSGHAAMSGESKTANALQHRSSVGTEALFVVASPKQLSRAMDELSAQADIAGFQVNSELLTQMLNPPPRTQTHQAGKVLRMDDLIAQSAQHSTNPLLRNSEPPQFDLTNPLRRAMAQQLRPFERNQRPSLANRAPSNHREHSSDSPLNGEQDSLDQLIYAPSVELNWNYSHEKGLSGDSFKGEEPTKLSIDPEQALRQYLLLIRVQAVPAESSGQSAPLAPAPVEPNQK